MQTSPSTVCFSRTLWKQPVSIAQFVIVALGVVGFDHAPFDQRILAVAHPARAAAVYAGHISVAHSGILMQQPQKRHKLEHAKKQIAAVFLGTIDQAGEFLETATA
jgi:hypothetical protein